VSSLGDDALSEIRSRRIGFVFQQFNLLPRITAQANVEMPLLYRDISVRDRRERAQRRLEVVGLRGRAGHRPAQLSGGEQQRVAIARALVNDPILLLADEPTGNLDTRTSDEIMAVVQSLHRTGLTVVLVTHEPDIARYAQRILSFRDGMLVDDEAVRDRRQARAA
jgi:putative ABC transport system ATP-binding protein